LVDLERLRNSGIKVIVDSMYGAGIGYFRRILSGGSTEVIEIHGERNPLFPGLQPEPIASNLGELSARVKGEGASAGLATDGDADRIGIHRLSEGVFSQHPSGICTACSLSSRGLRQAWRHHKDDNIDKHAL